MGRHLDSFIASAVWAAIVAGAIPIHPSPVDFFVEQYRSLVLIPFSQVSRWDSPISIRSELDPLQGLYASIHQDAALSTARFRLAEPFNALSSRAAYDIFFNSLFPRAWFFEGGRKQRPTCGDLEGPICAPLESLEIASTLFDHKGILENSLYLQRMKSLLKTFSPPRFWIEDGQKLKRVQLTMPQWEMIIKQKPSEFSRLLMSLDFDNGLEGVHGVFIPASNRLGDQLFESGDMKNISSLAAEQRRFYQSSPRSHETLARRREIPFVDRSFLGTARRWFQPGGAVDVTMNGGYVSDTESGDFGNPANLLSTSSYSLYDIDFPQNMPSHFESALGSMRPKLQEAMTYGLTWVRNAPLGPERSGGSLEAEFLMDNSTEHLKSVKADYDHLHMPWTIQDATAMSGQLRSILEDDVSLLRLIPNDSDWKTYASAMKISPAAVLEWSVAEADTDRQARPAAVPKKMMSKNSPSNSTPRPRRSTFHPAQLFYKFWRFEVYIARHIEQFIQHVNTYLWTGLWEEPPADEIEVNRPPGFKERDDKASEQVNAIWHAHEDAQEFLDHVTRPISPIGYSRYTGICRTWNLSAEVYPWTTDLSPGFSAGLPSSISASWSGSWVGPDVSDSVGATLMSNEGYIQFEPSIVIESLWINLKTDGIASFSEGNSSLRLRARLASAPAPSSDFEREQAFQRWQSLQPGEIINDSSFHVFNAWSILIPSEIVNDLIRSEKTVNLIEMGQRIEGSLVQRVTAVEFQWVKPQSEAKKEQPSKRRRKKKLGAGGLQAFHLGPIRLNLQRIDFDVATRLWSIDYHILESILSREEKLSASFATDSDLHLKILFKAKQQTELYSYVPSTFPSLFIEALAAPNNDTEHEAMVTVTDEKIAEPRNRIDLKEFNNANLQHYLTTHPKISMKTRIMQQEGGFPLVRGDPMTRGFGYVKAAQLAPDASLSHRLSNAMKDPAGRQAISGDGIVLHREYREITNLLRVHALDLPVEAPGLTLQMLHKHNLKFAFEISSLVEVDYTHGNLGGEVKPQSIEAKQKKILEALKQNLEKSEGLKSVMKKLQAQEGLLPSDGVMSEKLSPGPVNEKAERLEAMMESLNSGGSLDAGAAQDQIAAAFASGVGPGQRSALENDELRRSLEGVLRNVFEETLEDSAIRSITGTNFRELNVITMFEDPQTGELVSQTVSFEVGSAEELEEDPAATFSSDVEPHTAFLQEAIDDGENLEVGKPLVVSDYISLGGGDDESVTVLAEEDGVHATEVEISEESDGVEWEEWLASVDGIVPESDGMVTMELMVPDEEGEMIAVPLRVPFDLLRDQEGLQNWLDEEAEQGWPNLAGSSGGDFNGTFGDGELIDTDGLFDGD